MNLGVEEELPDPSINDPKLLEEARLLGVKTKPKPGMEPQDFIDREIKRRTMWSCFILDRYLSTGRSRPHMDVTTLEIQLPCSEDDFRFGSNVKTELLTPVSATKGSNSTSSGRVTQVDGVPLIGLFIRLVDIWGSCSKYSCAGGRRLVARSCHIDISVLTTVGKKNILRGTSVPTSFILGSSFLTSKHLFHKGSPSTRLI